MSLFGQLAEVFRAPGRQAQKRAVAVSERLLVKNLTRRTVLATQLEIAGTGKSRRRGLLGRNGPAPGEGLWIAPCESVHTFFMRFPIDLVYLDRKNRVRKVRGAVPAWRVSACLSAHSVLELPAGAALASQTQRGDQVEFAPAENSSQ